MEADGFDTKLDAFFDTLSIAPDDRRQARRVLMFRMGHRWQLGSTGAS